MRTKAPNPAKKTAVYCRVSTDDQRERQTVQTQIEQCQRYCNEHNLTVAGFYVDDGVTGTIPLGERPQGKRLIEEARAGLFDSVLLYKLDRLGRDTRLILNDLHLLEKELGLKVLSTQEELDSGSSGGHFLMVVQSEFAHYDRQNIVQRTTEASDRLAKLGAWMGGIVPYGYSVEGERREAKLIVSEGEIPGLGTSEADVVRTLFRLASHDHWSCPRIATYLNDLGVPTSYGKDQRLVLKGKRKTHTSGRWTPSRVRCILRNTTYKGVHWYGKRSKVQSRRCQRQVPPIVDLPTWERAQEVLTENFLFGTRNSHRSYLLRGKIKCSHCSQTYIGSAYTGGQRGPKVYYRCNGKHNGRHSPSLGGERCKAKDVGGQIEELVWNDVEGFIRDPGPVLAELANGLRPGVSEASAARQQRDNLERELAGKDSEKQLILDLLRKGRISESDLNQQLDRIHQEEEAVRGRVEVLRAQVATTASGEEALDSVADLLAALHGRLDAGLTDESKRRLVEILVDGGQARTIEDDQGRRVEVTVRYRFPSTESRTGRGSWRPPG